MASPDRIPRLAVDRDDYRMAEIGQFIVQNWQSAIRYGGDMSAAAEGRAGDHFIVDEDTPRTIVVAAALEALARSAANSGLAPSEFIARVDGGADDGKPHPTVEVGRVLKEGTTAEDWTPIVHEFRERCGHFHAFADHTDWPEDYADTPPDLAGHLTRAIEEQIAEWMCQGTIEKVRDVGDGLCYDFAEAIAKRLGVGGREGYGPIRMTFTEEFCRNDAASRKLLAEAGETVPSDIPFREFARWFDRATHQWMEFGGRHYDATAPEGVDRFLDLPFFADQIHDLRRERRPSPSR